MIVDRSIDYLQYSVAKLQDIGFDDMAVDSPLKFYKTMLVGKHGIQAHFGNPNSDKYLVVLSGKVCNGFTRDGTLKYLIDNSLSLGAKFSRVDWCITQYIDADGLVTRDDIAKAAREYKVISKWANHGCKSIVDEINKHRETTYIGNWSKRAKHGIFRAYDKGLELDLDKYLISRFEAEEKRDNAHTSVKRYINTDASIGSIMRSRIDILEPWWQELTSAEIADTSRGLAREEEEIESDTWSWLFHQVAPALGKELARDHSLGVGNKNLDYFMDEMVRAYRRNARNNA